MVDHLLERDASLDDDACTCIPATARQIIEKQFECLPLEHRELLEAASVAGVEFTPAQLPEDADIESNSARLEEQCEELVRSGQFLQKRGVAAWSDGVVAARYRFRHALHQEVLYDHISPTRRARLHQQIGERLEAGHGARADEIAGELAMHFERGFDPERAAGYLATLAETPRHRSANDSSLRPEAV